MRENATGELGGIITANFEYRVAETLGHGPVIDAYSGKVGSLVDSNEKISQPMKVPSGPNDNVLDRLSSRVQACHGPETRERGVFKKRQEIIGCTALNHLKITSRGGILATLRNYFNIEIS